MKFHTFFKLGALAAALTLAGASQAAVLAGAAPYSGNLNGAQADDATGSYVQSFDAAPAGAVLESIVWWGYRRNFAANSAPYVDDFLVTLNGDPQIGIGPVQSAPEFVIGGDFTVFRYTLDVADVALTATNIEIVNRVDNFEWYWQSTDSTPFGFPGYTTAFNLIGTVPTNTTPEPSSLALIGLAGLALAATRRLR